MKSFGLQTFIWENNIKSMVLLGIFPLLLTLEIYFIVFAFVVGSSESGDPFKITNQSLILLFPLILLGVGFWFLIAFFLHKQMTLSMAGAVPIDRNVNPRIYNIVENLAISRGLPVPRIYFIPDTSLNAFATGWSPNDSVIAFSQGILERLNDQEVEAVAAHELTHIINRDIRLMAVAIIFVGIITTLAEIFVRIRISGDSDRKNGAGVIFLIQILVFVLGYLISIVVQLAISRKREFLADAGSVELTKNPDAMISALEKISIDPTVEVIKNKQMAQICIENPLSEQSKIGFLSKMFSTHPPIADRIQAIKMIS
ncbi:M48 family metallopeptidase [Candidatus Dojkabacteria bacterium]|nr:M48 family metallopeptidase [Candidatus Dojkabacteria bacterium]